jgi:hypothetical protein
MSASKLDTSGTFNQTNQGNCQTRLALPSNGVSIRQNGIEFLSSTPFPTWTEMTVELQSASKSENIKCNGIIVACDGSETFGYSISMVFINLSPQSQNLLNSLAISQLS